jgi:hypothetical protein
MANCELIAKCIFFNDQMANMPSTAEVFKNLYCRDNSSHCARYVACKALGREKVPQDLFPNQLDRANELVG